MTDRSVNLFFGALRLEHLVEGCGGAADLGRCEAGAGEFAHDLGDPARRYALEIHLGAGETVAVAVRIGVSEDLSFERVAIQLGDQLATQGDGTAREFTLVNLPAGIHRVIAVGIQADGGRELSGPHTILVR